MTTSATVRVMSPEEITARAGGETAYFHFPARATMFAERAMRLRQLASGHALGDYLEFIAALALAQQQALARFPAVPVPDGPALDRAAAAGLPPLPASEWPRDPAWHAALRDIVATLKPQASGAAADALARLGAADADELERQADCLLTGVMAGLDLATAPVVAGALQVYWAHMVQAVLEDQRSKPGAGQAFGRLDDPTVCPCCGSRPVASIARGTGDATGQRYLHCSLCGTQWHLERIKCTHCLATQHVAYESLDAGGEDPEGAAARAAQAAVQAETCDDCGHYLKIMHAARDPFVDPVADDLATITLDLLVSEAGRLRHGVNLMLLFGEPPPPEKA